ncbi:MAG: MATE family efflux transporter [Coprobacillus sp.]
MKKFFGNKAFYMTTLAIALPIMAQQFVTSFVNLIDNIMIGSVGTIALTSVTVANRVYLIFNSTMFGICGAAGIFIAQYYGAKKKENCQKILNINLVCGIIVSFIFVLALLLIPRQLMEIFSSNPIVIEESLKYIQYALLTYTPFAISFSIMMALRAVGINRIQLLVGVITVAINTSLNYVLIFGHFGFPALGVQGAAIATAIARFVEMFIYIIILVRKKHMFYINIKELFHLDFSLIRSMTRKAIPLTINEIFFSLGMAMLFLSYVRCDESLISAISVVDTVIQIGFIIFGGLSSAISILIGKRLGANEIDEAKENAYKLITFGVVIGIIVGSIFILIAPLIASFYNVELIIKEAIVSLLRIKSFLIPIYVYNVCIFFVLRAGGDTFSTMLMDSGFLWIAGVLVSTVLSMFFEIPLVWLYLIVESLDIVKLFVARYFFKKGNWAKNMTITLKEAC